MSQFDTPILRNTAPNVASRGREPDVGRQAQREPAADGGPVDRSDPRFAGAMDALVQGRQMVLPHEAADRAADALAAGRGALVLQISAGAEPPAGAGEDDRPRLRVEIDGADDVVEIGDDRRGDGVHALGTVQGDEHDVVVGLGDVDRVEGVGGDCHRPMMTTERGCERSRLVDPLVTKWPRKSSGVVIRLGVVRRRIAG